MEGVGGSKHLPPLHLACSGLAPNAKKEDWLKLASVNDRLQRGMARLHTLFKDAPVLGSLINPRAMGGDLVEADFHELQPLLEKALAPETKDDAMHEMAVTACGLGKAGEILVGQFTLVVTNLPYLTRSKQNDLLMNYCKRVHPVSKADLATCFVERCFSFAHDGASTCLVTPQNWLFLGRYTGLREQLLKTSEWKFVGKLGPHAFETIGGEVVNVALLNFTKQRPEENSQVIAFDVADEKVPSEKAVALKAKPLATLKQNSQSEILMQKSL